MKLFILSVIVSSSALAKESNFLLVKNSKIENAKSEIAIRHLHGQIVKASSIEAERLSLKLDNRK